MTHRRGHTWRRSCRRRNRWPQFVTMARSAVLSKVLVPGDSSWVRTSVVLYPDTDSLPTEARTLARWAMSVPTRSMKVTHWRHALPCGTESPRPTVPRVPPCPVSPGADRTATEDAGAEEVATLGLRYRSKDHPFAWLTGRNPRVIPTTTAATITTLRILRIPFTISSCLDEDRLSAPHSGTPVCCQRIHGGQNGLPARDRNHPKGSQPRCAGNANWAWTTVLPMWTRPVDSAVNTRASSLPWNLAACIPRTVSVS